MKNLIWIILATCLMYACKDHSGYTIKGEAEGIDGEKVVLKKISLEFVPVDMDSTVVKNGKFEMKGLLEYPEYCALYVGDNGPVVFFLENAAIQVTINKDDISASEVTGSKETDLFAGFNNGMKEIETRINKVNDDYMSLKLSGETDVEREQNYVAQMDQLREERVHYMENFVKSNPNTIVSALLIDRNLSYYISADELETFANGFDEKNSKSPWVQSIQGKAEIAKRLSEGQPFINVSMPNPEGETIALSDYAGKGKYVLIDFWASWCRPCRMANPHIVKLYKAYKDKGFEIVGISLDRDKSEWIKAIKDDALTWPQMSDLKFWQSEGARLYSVSSIPHTVLLDKEGKILAKNLRDKALEEKLAELLK